MESIFNTIIDSYIDTQVGTAENFISEALSTHLKNNLLTLFNKNQLRAAGTGNNNSVIYDQLIRRDRIYWLDRKHNDPYENAFFDLMDQFVEHLNHTCYTGITGYEFHYTLYEKGSFYKKHLDQFQNNGNRVFSMVMYLNADWQTADGGELCIHHADHLQHISPNNGKSVFFKSSELPHEVLVTGKPRMSITGWLKVN